MNCEKAEKWYIHQPEKILESEECKILRNFPIQTDKRLEHNRPDITDIEKKDNSCKLIDPSCSLDTCIEKKEEAKCTNYNEIARIWKMKKWMLYRQLLEH